MQPRQTLECSLFVIGVALTRWLFRSHCLYDIDSVNFALAIRRFDPVAYQPHPPGYFLYIYLGRLINALFQDANTALVAISIAASCGAVAVIYMLALNWFGPTAATSAGLIFLFSPLAWFHGTVALIYIVEAFLSAMAGYLCWRVCCGQEPLVFPAAAILGLGAGIRPSFLLFLAPLFLFSLRAVRRKQAIIGVVSVFVTVLLWFIPMLGILGGLRMYLSSLFTLWQIAGGHQTVLNSPPLMSAARFLTIGLVYALCFGSATLLWRGTLRRNDTELRRKKLFTWVWLAPGLLFFTFVFLRFVNSGYLLVIFPPVCAWVGLWASEWYARLPWPKPLKIALIGLAAAVNTVIFVRAPLYCSYKSVRHLEAEIGELQQEIPRIASPQQTLIIGFDSHFLGYRHAGYYLPSYEVVQYPEVQLPQGKRVFVMQQGDTHLAEEIGNCTLSNFMLFPLPSGERRYADYFEKIRAKFPAQDLHTVRAGNHDFVFGPISDLRILFPIIRPFAPCKRIVKWRTP